VFGMPDISKMVGRRRSGSKTRGILLFALGAAVGMGVSRMRNQNHYEQRTEDAQGPMEVDI
jgi:hypothetical protein